MRLLTILLVLLVHHAAAEAKCKHKGTILFRLTSDPLKDAPADEGELHTELEIYATGAWVVVLDLANRDEPATATGCLTKAHLKELKRTLAKAKFKLDDTGRGTCRAVSTMQVVYASPKRKKKVTTAQLCGTPVDTWTANLVACAELVVGSRPVAEMRAICRGEDLP